MGTAETFINAQGFSLPPWVGPVAAKRGGQSGYLFAFYMHETCLAMNSELTSSPGFQLLAHVEGSGSWIPD